MYMPCGCALCCCSKLTKRAFFGKLVHRLYLVLIRVDWKNDDQQDWYFLTWKLASFKNKYVHKPKHNAERSAPYQVPGCKSVSALLGKTQCGYIRQTLRKVERESFLYTSYFIVAFKFISQCFVCQLKGYKRRYGWTFSDVSFYRTWLLQAWWYLLQFSVNR